MEEHSISGLTESVVTITGGLPGVYDTSFSQPVSCTGPVIKDLLVMAE